MQSKMDGFDLMNSSLYDSANKILVSVLVESNTFFVSANTFKGSYINQLLHKLTLKHLYNS